MKAVNRIIDSVWTLQYEFINDGIMIQSHSRDDQEGYEKESKLPNFNLIETDKRVVKCAVIDGVKYNVINPKHVFTYK